MKQSWSDGDRRRFADGDRLKASSVPGKRLDGPVEAEWDDCDHQWRWVDHRGGGWWCRRCKLWEWED
jgi:hypothetical protein